MKKQLPLALILLMPVLGCQDPPVLGPDTSPSTAVTLTPPEPEMSLGERSEEDWQSTLSPEQFYVLRQKGTERPFLNEFDMHFEPGSYSCAGCSQVLFESDTKFNSGCGWPAFYAAKAGDRIKQIPDYSLGGARIEVTCSKCGGHLGHVFDDAPSTPTGQRYCINSVSLKFTPRTAEDGKASAETASSDKASDAESE